MALRSSRGLFFFAPAESHGEHASPPARFEHVIFWRPERQLTSFVVIAVAALLIAVGAAIFLTVLVFS